MKAAILSIGSELLSGQIINRNAPWLSARLFELGIDTVFQMTVDDRTEAITEALDIARAKGDLILCTGGLGPTSDDVTREAVAGWLGKPLVYNAAAWEHIEKIFAQFGTQPPETNKRQCYFPAESTILENPAGTAHGFCHLAPDGSLYVLPGPPKEIEALWSAHVHRLLLQCLSQGRSETTGIKAHRSWRTIGRGESHVAEIVEKVLRDLVAQQAVEIAYRAHAPFIETKIRYEKSLEHQVSVSLDELTLALGPWLYEKDGENWIETLANEIMSQRRYVEIYDFWSGGQVQTSLEPFLFRGVRRGHGPQLMIQSFWNSPAELETFLSSLTEASLHDSVLVLVLLPGEATMSDGRHQTRAKDDASDAWRVSVIEQGQLLGESRSLPYQLKVPRERQDLAVAYLAIKYWAQALHSKMSS